MLFNTAQFVLFFLAVAAVHWLLPSRWRNAWLLAASAVFYTLWLPVYSLLFLAVMLVNYGLAVAIQRSSNPRTPLVVSIVFTLGVLAWFKYRGFFLQTVAWLAGQDASMVELFLPLGISFYSFVIIALNVDIYRGRMQVPGFARYVLFVMFFPHLIAGPILRGSEFLPQLELGGVYTSDRMRRGLWLVAWGMFKKVVLSDFLLAPFVNSVLDQPGLASAPVHLIAIYTFAFQIYCDFSGYSDIARGLACLLGYELPLNFAEPYLSRNPAEFWRRWHMTLSRWLRDYLYVPLGGNRGAPARTAFNLFATMLLGGLWHGASWTFVVWGGLHGLLLVVHRAISRRSVGNPTGVGMGDVIGAVLTFHAVTLLWVVFRSPDLASAWTVFDTLATKPWTGEWPFLQMGIVSFCAILHVIERLVTRRANEIVERTRCSWPVAAAEGFALGLTAFLVVLCNGTGVAFIYFQF